jgi:hypothetical protein
MNTKTILVLALILTGCASRGYQQGYGYPYPYNPNVGLATVVQGNNEMFANLMRSLHTPMPVDQGYSYQMINVNGMPALHCNTVGSVSNCW